MRVAVGGTFNVLHAGHRELFKRALETGLSLVVAFTSDDMASNQRDRVRPLEERVSDVAAHLDPTGVVWEWVTIDTPEGTAVGDDSLSMLIVSPETSIMASEINRLRESEGLRPVTVIEVPHILADDGLPISSTRVLSGRIDAEGRLLGEVTVGVGSTNPVKSDAVEDVLSQVFDDLSVRRRDVLSGIDEQPKGIETREGAINRARAAIGDCDLGVGIEAGVFETPYGMMDVQQCAIVDRGGRVTIGQGPGFIYPEAIAEMVRSGSTVGDAFARLLSRDGMGRDIGAIGYLTGGMMDRRALTRDAVIAAMVPRMRSALYR